jgi:hypothetical protein
MCLRLHILIKWLQRFIRPVILSAFKSSQKYLLTCLTIRYCKNWNCCLYVTINARLIGNYILLFTDSTGQSLLLTVKQALCGVNQEVGKKTTFRLFFDGALRILVS